MDLIGHEIMSDKPKLNPNIHESNPCPECGQNQWRRINANFSICEICEAVSKGMGTEIKWDDENDSST